MSGLAGAPDLQKDAPKPRAAVVTGAGGGIGRSVALRLARDGARVALLDINAETLASVVEAIHALGGQAEAIATDCLDLGSIRASMGRAREILGPCDVLVNNVGQSGGAGVGPFSETDFRNLDRFLAINLKASMYCAREVVGEMKDRREGRIINVASDAAFVGDLSSWDYAASKAGVIGFTRSLARELASFGVTVNAVAPGFTRTAMTDAVSETSRERILSGVPMGEVIEPDDIAGAIAFLAGPDSRFVTGQTLAVNGGRWML